LDAELTDLGPKSISVVALAQASGLTVMLEGVIGRQRYESVAGSLEALERFARLYRCIYDDHQASASSQ
jgi:hypothetical protein